MVERKLRVGAAIIALPQLITGIWAVAGPSTWFERFPGFGPALVAATPPYNPHLATDAGAGLFATALIVVVAAAWGSRDALVIALGGLAVFVGLHTWFHLANPSPGLSAGENVYNAAILIAEFALSVALLLLVRTAQSSRSSSAG